ncbi:ABC transporter substrate-binding protein [Metabacillus fastidiosus]|uniref:ABC transporter substrate-binding protein n=1 Tax=Metabacillus fastidiosus TaxID=1458 RepID=UPI003D264EFE
MGINLKGKKAFRSICLFSILSLFVLAIIQGCSSNNTNSRAEEKTNETAGVPTVLNYGYIGVNELNLPNAAEGWGFHKGIIQEELKKHGITKINLTGFPNGPDLNESLISGRLDLGGLGDTPAILAKSSGANTKLIAQPLTRNIGYLIGKKDGPKKIKDLEGKTIAIQKGSFMHRYVVGLLKKEGIKNYSLVHMLRPDGEAALARGEVDAMTNSSIYSQKLLEEGFTHLDDASKHPELYGSSVTVVSEDFLKKFPKFPEVWNKARQKALEDLKKNEKEYYELIAKLTKSTPELVKETTPIDWIEEEAFTDEGLELLDGTKKFLVEEKLAQKDFDLNDWVTK